MNKPNPFTYDEFKSIAEELYHEGKMSLEEYQICLENNQDKNSFDGKLTTEQLKELRARLVSEKQIRKIEEYLMKYKDHLSDYTDLVGDDLVPGKFFNFNMKHFGHLLEDDPEKVMSKSGIEIRKRIFFPLVKALGPLFLGSKQIFENRNDLLLERDYRTGAILPNQNLDLLKGKINPQTGKPLPDSKIVLPEKPVIWTLNHHFKDDALATVIACLRAVYILFGSLPQFYNTLDGVLAFLVGSAVVNRKVSSSKKASYDKIGYAIDLGSDIMWAPEGVWNKDIGKLLQELWPGVYRASNEKDTGLVPVIHYVYDPTQKINKKYNPIHTVVDDPIHLASLGLSEKASLEYYREVMAYWYTLMMKKYGYAKKYEIKVEDTQIKTEQELERMTTNELKRYYNNLITENYNELVRSGEDLSTRQIVLRGLNNPIAAGEIYMQDLMDTVDRYDLAIEKSAHYRPKDKITPLQVYGNMAKLPITKENKDNVEYARKLVREYQKNDFQSRF